MPRITQAVFSPLPLLRETSIAIENRGTLHPLSITVPMKNHAPLVCSTKITRTTIQSTELLIKDFTDSKYRTNNTDTSLTSVTDYPCTIDLRSTDQTQMAAYLWQGTPAWRRMKLHNRVGTLFHILTIKCHHALLIIILSLLSITMASRIQWWPTTNPKWHQFSIRVHTTKPASTRLLRYPSTNMLSMPKTVSMHITMANLFSIHLDILLIPTV
jgi:hypothetical protein